MVYNAGFLFSNFFLYHSYAHLMRSPVLKANNQPIYNQLWEPNLQLATHTYGCLDNDDLKGASLSDGIPSFCIEASILGCGDILFLGVKGVNYSAFFFYIDLPIDLFLKLHTKYRYLTIYLYINIQLFK